MTSIGLTSMSTTAGSSLGANSKLANAATDYVLVPRCDWIDRKDNVPSPVVSPSSDVQSDLPPVCKAPKRSLGVGTSTDSKEKEQAQSAQMSLVRSVMTSARKRSQVYQFSTATRYTTSGTSGSAFYPVATLLPNATSVTEATQLAAIFDEGRCRGITVHAAVDGAYTGGTAGAWALVFDPSNSGPYTSVVGALVSGQHIGPVQYNNPGSHSTTSMTKTGYMVKEFKTLSVAPTAALGTASEVVGSNWFGTLDTSVICGYLKFACDANPGGSGAVNVDLFIIYHMEYRSRT